jgi:hypothetical protein
MNKIVNLLCAMLLFIAPSKAQDSSFIHHYKNFRALVDSYKTYSLYIVPYQSARLHPIPESKSFFREAYHFLNDKKVVKKNPDFVAVVLIDSLQLVNIEEVIKPIDKTSVTPRETVGGIHDHSAGRYSQRYHYQFTFNVVVQTRKDKIYRFPLANQSIVLNSILNTGQYHTMKELERLLEYALARYKNYYIDRVDW